MIRKLAAMLLGMVILGCTAVNVPTERTRTMDPQAVLNKTWQWTSTTTPVEKISVAAPERYTIHLTSDSKVQAQFDCNKGGGSFEISEGRISFGPLISTRMACPPDSLDNRFVRDLQRVTSYFVQDMSLYLELPYDTGTMMFLEAP